MGAKSEAFCRQALTVLDKNRQVAPSTLDLDSALAALATIDQLRPRAKRIVQLAERLRDSEQLLGANVAKAARKVMDRTITTMPREERTGKAGAKKPAKK